MLPQVLTGLGPLFSSGCIVRMWCDVPVYWPTALSAWATRSVGMPQLCNAQLRQSRLSVADLAGLSENHRITEISKGSYVLEFHKAFRVQLVPSAGEAVAARW